jgi:beta-carotene/zeaxanthin 4-ketolase
MAQAAYELKHRPNWVGFALGLFIVLAWSSSTAYWLSHTLPPLWSIPFVMLLHTFLYTGMFITTHDAIHGLLAPNRWANRALGTVCALLFAFNWYPRLLKHHHAHHRHVATELDPDFHQGGFWPWYFRFLRNYLTIWQFLAMAALFNLLLLIGIGQAQVILFWMLPALLSTLQLFYFGTYLPHRGEFPSDNLHHARSQPPNHLWAFVSCYFFGYHWEHHQYPYVPWWQLWRYVK